jgi:hypothetical protein
MRTPRKFYRDAAMLVPKFATQHVTSGRWSIAWPDHTPPVIADSKETLIEAFADELRAREQHKMAQPEARE